MKQRVVVAVVIVFLLAGCFETRRTTGEISDEGSALRTSVTDSRPVIGPPKQPIDLGDVDSGVFIRGILAPGAEAPNITAEYMENVGGQLFMTTITVKEPFPEVLPIRFELNVKRNFAERPVVVRFRALNENNEVISEEYACVLGKDARTNPLDASGKEVTRGFTINVLEGLETIPDTLLVHGRGDAWLMPEGTVETLLDPKVAQSSERITLLGNPVRINFVRSESSS